MCFPPGRGREPLPPISNFRCFRVEGVQSFGRKLSWTSLMIILCRGSILGNQSGLERIISTEVQLLDRYSSTVSRTSKTIKIYDRMVSNISKMFKNTLGLNNCPLAEPTFSDQWCTGRRTCTAGRKWPVFCGVASSSMAAIKIKQSDI
jgi:hypothetical protein